MHVGVSLKQTFRLEQCLARIVDNRGRTPPLTDEGVELIEINALEEGRKFPDFERIRKFVSDETYSSWFRSGHPKLGDTLISTVGAIGRVAFVHKERGCIAQNIIALRPKPDMLEGEFLFYYLASKETQQRLMNLNIGVAQPSLKVPHLLSLDIELPPLPVQRRIASILSVYDELIENNQRRIRILDDMARSLYQEWFVHFRYPGHESVPLADSTLGQIPQGWEMKKLGDIAEDMRRNIPKGQLDEPQPYVGLEHIPRRSLALDSWEIASELGSNKFVFKKGEILFGKIRPYFHKVSIAPFDGLCSADTIVIRARQPEHYAIVVGCVSSDEFVAHATATSNGSKMPRANWSVLEEYPIAIPTLTVARQFSAVMESAIQQMQKLIFQTANLRRTRDLLLPRLLSGQVSINEI
jgi:type I restriction enzyme S subunit